MPKCRAHATDHQKEYLMALKGVLVDIDGTLLDSNDAHAEAFAQAFQENGHNISFDRVRPLFGMGGDQVFPRLVPGLSDKEGDGKTIADLNCS